MAAILEVIEVSERRDVSPVGPAPYSDMATGISRNVVTVRAPSGRTFLIEVPDGLAGELSKPPIPGDGWKSTGPDSAKRHLKCLNEWVVWHVSRDWMENDKVVPLNETPRTWRATLFDKGKVVMEKKAFTSVRDACDWADEQVYDPKV